MRLFVALAVLASALAAPVALAQAPFPDTIALPNGWQPEGIAVGDGSTFYAGSIPTGAVFRGDLRTGAGSVLVPGMPGVRSATGLKYDRGRLFVSGAQTGKAWVYSATTGALIRESRLHHGWRADVHQRRRRDEGRGVLHRLETRPRLQAPARGRRYAGRSRADVELLTGDFRP